MSDVASSKIERLASLNPKTAQVSQHSLEMFRLLRGFAILDWTLKHPNDLGTRKAEVKFEALVEKTWELLSTMQDEIEGNESVLEDDAAIPIIGGGR